MNLGLFNIDKSIFQELTLWLVPVGTGHDWWGTENTIPKGYVLADGTIYPMTKYPRLGKLFGSTYGGDGVTTFAVPDKRGRVSVTKDNMGGTSANRVTAGGSGLTGSTLGAVGGDQLAQAHNHGTSIGATVPTYIGGADGLAHNVVQDGQDGVASGTASLNVTVNVLSNLSGASQNIQPSIICNYIIRAG